MELPEHIFTRLVGGSETGEFVVSMLERQVVPNRTEDWLLTQHDFTDYVRATYAPLWQVLYSPDGAWAIVVNDEYAVAGCATSSEAEMIEAAAGDLADPRRFVDQLRRDAEHEGFAITESWTTELLAHVLGPEKAESLLADVE